MTDEKLEEHGAHVMPEGKEPPPRGARLMAVVRWLLVLVMAFVAVAAVTYGYDVGKRPAASAHAEVWTCPMHPSVVQDHPGNCPICGMKLVKREDLQKSESAGPTTSASASAVPGLSPIDLSLDRVQLIGMKTAKATREALAPELRTVGYVAAPESGLSKVTTRFPGWIDTLVVSETGRKVKRGELLALVYSPQVYLAEQEYLTSRGVVVGNTDLSGDARKRLELLGVSPAEIAAIEKSGKPNRTTPIVAPANGWVIQKSAVQGGYFQAGVELFTLANLSKVWIVADVYESELARVKTGQTATLTLTTYPDKSWSGAVKFIYPTVDSATRTAKVRLEFDNEGMELRPGMYGNVAIALPSSTGVVVPREALVDTGEVQYVFIEHHPGHYEPRRVTVGMRAGERVEIRSGVAEGERVVTTGNFLLDSESRLRAAIAGGG